MVKKYKKLYKRKGGSDFLDMLENSNKPPVSSYHNPLTTIQYKEPSKPFSIFKPKENKMRGFESNAMHRKYYKPEDIALQRHQYSKRKQGKLEIIKRNLENFGSTIKNGVIRVYNKLRGKGKIIYKKRL